MVTTIFIACSAALLYIYMGYPTLLWILQLLSKKRPSAAPKNIPHVSLIIAAYNEGSVIDAKLQNCLQLNYPSEKLEIIVASDGSNDNTNDVVKRYAKHGIRLLDIHPRGGKPRAVNIAVQQAAHDIIVFSDCNAFYHTDAITQLVTPLAEASVGAVSGDVRLQGTEQQNQAQEEGMYYRYERAIQAWESKIGSIVGVDGALFAIKKSLYIPPPEDIICDDLVISQNIVRQGYRVQYNPQAIAWEDTTATLQQELQRRARYTMGGVKAFFRRQGWARLSQPLAWWMYISHKLLRYFSPLFLLILYAATCMQLGTTVWNMTWTTQMIFYGAATWGYWHQGPHSPAICRVPFYFVMQNIGSLLGIGKAIWSPAQKTWTSPERHSIEQP